MPPLILASASSIRAQLLRQAGVTVEAFPADLDERALEQQWRADDWPPDELAMRLAAAKALHVSQRYPGRLVLGADQLLVCGKQRFNKPHSRAEAKKTLLKLQGTTHYLHTGFGLVKNGAVRKTGVTRASLAMRRLSEAAIEAYLDTAGDAVLGSVGCYQLEGFGVTLLSGIEGDYFSILGLPLLQVLQALREIEDEP